MTDEQVRQMGAEVAHECDGLGCDVCGGETCPLCGEFCSVWNDEHRRYIHEECVAEYEGTQAEFYAEDEREAFD